MYLKDVMFEQALQGGDDGSSSGAVAHDCCVHPGVGCLYLTVCGVVWGGLLSLLPIVVPCCGSAACRNHPHRQKAAAVESPLAGGTAITEEPRPFCLPACLQMRRAGQAGGRPRPPERMPRSRTS